MSKTIPFGSDLGPPASALPPKPALAPVARPVPLPSPVPPESKPGQSSPGAAAEGASDPAKEGSLVGQKLRHFKIEGFVASGGMGEVYRGLDTGLNRPVAIKTLRPQMARDKRFLGAFLMEAQAQANVFHPHVLQVYYIGADKSDMLFMAMQLVEGGSLEDLIQSRRPITWQQAAKHMLGIADGLAAAARLGIVHRDIKPGNILLDQFGEAHLSDFGLAVAGAVAPPLIGEGQTRSPSGRYTSGGFKPSHPDLASPTRPGQVTGTLEYMAPEQARGELADQRMDIYGLGATFYHVLTGRAPAQVGSLAELQKFFDGPPQPPLRKLAPHVPREFADLIDRCLARDKSKRYQTHEELVAALRRAGPQPEVPASPVLRAMSWFLEALPIAGLLRLSYGATPWAAFTAYFLAVLAALIALRATPGQWLMRLRLRTVADGDVPIWRGLARFVFQNGWILPLCYSLNAAFRGSIHAAMLLGIGALAGLALPALGSLGALFGRRQALHDFITGTRVLVDVR